MSRLVDDTAAPSSGEEPAKAPEDKGEPERTQAEPATPPGLRERARIRRRIRYLRQLRELQLRDLGGFLLEQRRFARENPSATEAKLVEAARTDQELRALERALGERRDLREVREPGIGGACSACGAVHGSTDRYCSWCGQQL